MTRKFISGSEAFAEGARLARPDIVSVCPGIVGRAFSDMAAAGVLDADVAEADSPHMALTQAADVAAAGCRGLVATTSQGLLGMADLLSYASCASLPLVMQVVVGATDPPWGVSGGPCGAPSLADHGWIQAYPRTAQEALDLALMAFRIAEDPRVRVPIAVNLEGRALAAACEMVDVPAQDQADAFLSACGNGREKDAPVFSGEFSATDAYRLNERISTVTDLLPEVEDEFSRVFGRRYTGALEGYRAEDADYVVVVLGTAYGAACDVVDELRDAGVGAGALRLRYLRPFPDEALVEALEGKIAAAVVEKTLSFGYEGMLFTNLNSALYVAGEHEGRRESLPKTFDYLCGFGARGVTADDVHAAFAQMADGGNPASHAFLGLGK